MTRVAPTEALTEAGPTVADSTRPRIDVPRIGRQCLAVLRARWHLRKAQTLGAKTRVYGWPSIQLWGETTVGERVQLVSTVARLEIVVAPDAVLEIGDETFVNYGSSISVSRSVRIGPGCLLGPHVLIMDSDFHQLDPARRRERPTPAPVVLEENVWLAARVTVLRGVTIGANSAIAAGSVVTKDIPPNTLAAGVPAKVIRQL